MPANLSLEEYFLATGFADLLPLALKMAQRDGYGQKEIIEAICLVADKTKTYPPTRNRVAWFATVFREKLQASAGGNKGLRKKNSRLNARPGSRGATNLVPRLPIFSPSPPCPNANAICESWAGVGNLMCENRPCHHLS